MIFTVTINNSQANKQIAAPVACNNNQNMCVYGSYCTGLADTCTGVCHNSCFKCNGPSSTQCTQCNPFSDRGRRGPSNGSCGNSK